MEMRRSQTLPGDADAHTHSGAEGAGGHAPPLSRRRDSPTVSQRRRDSPTRQRPKKTSSSRWAGNGVVDVKRLTRFLQDQSELYQKALVEIAKINKDGILHSASMGSAANSHDNPHGKRERKARRDQSDVLRNQTSLNKPPPKLAETPALAKFLKL